MANDGYEFFKLISMAPEITQTCTRKIYCNGKLVARDMNGEWVTTEELTTVEGQHLRKFLTSNNLLNEQ